MNGDADDQRDKVYRIQIPGMKGFVSVPAEKKLTPEVKDIIIKRYMAKYSPVPRKLQWIPGVINQIDDAQDLLSVALTLGKPLLRKLPGRFIPGLGWILLANDILNLGTAILSIPLQGRPGKNIGRNVLRYMAGNKFKRAKVVQKWLSTTNWLGFSLQAGQVSTTLTGYGLKLGPLMGMVSDITWGAVRKLQGAQVEIKGPPPDDYIDKAARFLAQGLLDGQSRDGLAEEHQNLLIAATNLATNALREAQPAAILEERIPILRATQVPVHEPWDDDTRRVLVENGIPWDGIKRPRTTLSTNTPTYYDFIRSEATTTANYEAFRRAYGGVTEETGVSQIIYNEAGNNVFDKMVDGDDNLEDEWGAESNGVQSSIEFAVYPPHTATKTQVNSYLNSIRFYLEDAGLTFPTAEMLQSICLDRWGGYDTEPPVDGYK